MEIKPVYIFYGDEKYLIQKDVDFFRHYFAKEGCTIESFDGNKTDVNEVLMAAETNPLFGDKRLIIVNDAPWFGAKKKAADESAVKKKNDVKPYEAPLLSYFENPNTDVCLVFLATAVDKRKKVAKAAESCGTVREYKTMTLWELPDYLRRFFRKQNKSISGRAVDLLIALVGESTPLLCGEGEKLVLYVGERNTIEESDVYRVVSRSAEANSFQLSDAVGERHLSKVCLLTEELLREMKPGEFMGIFGYLTNYLRLLIRIKEADEKGMREDAIAKALKIHIFRIKKGIPAARNYTMTELVTALESFAQLEFQMKSGAGDFKDLFLASLMTIIRG